MLSICTLSFWYKLAVSIFDWTYLIFSNVRACSHESGVPRVPGVPRLGGVPSVSIYFLLFIWLRSHAWWGTPLSRATCLLGVGCPPEWGRFFHVNTIPRGTGVRFIRAFDNLARQKQAGKQNGVHSLSTWWAFPQTTPPKYAWQLKFGAK